MSEFLVVSSTFTRVPLLAVPLVASLLIGFGALLLRLPGFGFGEPKGSHAPAQASYLPLAGHLGLVLLAGIYLPSPLVAWFQNVARLLGHYVRDEHATSLQDAVRRLTSLPATNIGIRQRGSLKPGYYGDVIVFDPATIADHATFEKPDQLATGVDDVFINGVQVLRDGKHTGAKPGRVVRGPGWTGWPGGGACK